MNLTESIVEEAALEWFGEMGYAIGHGPQFAPGEPAAEPACASHADRRDSFGAVVLAGRLSEAIRRLNPAIPEEASACAAHADRRVAIKRNLKARFVTRINP